MNDLIARIPSRVEQNRIHSLGSKYWVPRWIWLRWVMKKLRLLKPTTYTHTYSTYVDVTIRATNIIEFLRKYQEGLLDGYGYRVSDLYVGREHFFELIDIHDKMAMRDGKWAAVLSVEVPDVYGEKDQFQTMKWHHNVKVHFIPWFKGVLAIPPHMRPGSVDHRMEGYTDDLV